MEKKIKPVTVKFTETGEEELRIQARVRLFEVSEYIRHLVEKDKKVLSEQFHAMKGLFTINEEIATFTESD